jgi:hypothetical protein
MFLRYLQSNDEIGTLGSALWVMFLCISTVTLLVWPSIAFPYKGLKLLHSAEPDPDRSERSPTPVAHTVM